MPPDWLLLVPTVLIIAVLALIVGCATASEVSGEAFQVTDVKTAVTGFKWSPDERSIGFTAPGAASEAQERSACKDGHLSPYRACAK